MDPLSLTASIIAIIGAGAQVAETVKRFASLRDAVYILLALNNEISDLHLVVLAIQDLLQRQRASTVEVAPDGVSQFSVDASVTSSLKYANERVEELRAFHDRIATSPSASCGPQTFRKAVWLREQGRIKQMQEDLRTARLKLSTALEVLNSSTLLRLEAGLRNLQNDIRDIHSIQEQIGIRQERCFVKHVTPLRDPVSQMLVTQQRIDLRLNVIEAISIANASATPSQPVRVLATSSRWRCIGNCTCICHRRGSVRTPRYMDHIFGSLFLGYAGLPVLTLPCGNLRCTQRESIAVSLSYFFPPWLLARTLLFVLKLSLACGPEIILRVPRIIRCTSAFGTMKFARAGDIEGLRELFQRGLGSPFDVDGLYGNTPLMIAVNYAQVETCRFLLNAGADPHQENYAQITVFNRIWTFVFGKNKSYTAGIVEAMRELFPSQTIVEDFGFTFLHKVVLGINPVDLGSLLQTTSTTLLNESDANGRTALWWAAYRGGFLAVSLLLGKGADVNKATVNGSRPLDAAIAAGDQICVRLILESGCAVNYMSSTGAGPVSYFCYMGGDIDTLELLLSRGADMDQRYQNTRETPLLLALQQDHTQICHSLIERGADLNAQDINGERALHRAIRHNRHQSLRTLLQHKVNRSLKTNYGENLLHFAAQYGDLETVKILGGFCLTSINLEDRVTAYSSEHMPKDVRGCTAIEIAEAKHRDNPEWLEAFQKVLRNVGPSGDSQIQTVPVTVEEEEIFEDAVERQ